MCVSAEPFYILRGIDFNKFIAIRALMDLVLFFALIAIKRCQNIVICWANNPMQQSPGVSWQLNET